MKVEVELQELEKLRTQITKLSRENDALHNKLKELSELQLREAAVELSYNLFDSYMESVFKNLGFEKWIRQSVQIDKSLIANLGKNWFQHENIEFKINARICKDFKAAFLSMGVLTPNKDL